MVVEIHKGRRKYTRRNVGRPLDSPGQCLGQYVKHAEAIAKWYTKFEIKLSPWQTIFLAIIRYSL